MEDNNNNNTPSMSLNLGGIPPLTSKTPNTGLNLNFQLGNLEDLKQEDNSPKAQPFSWVNEFEAIEAQMVTSREVLEVVDQHNCLAKIVTLEGEFFDLSCSVAKGIKVTATDNQGDFLGNIYESLEALLMRASPLYIKAFTSVDRDD